MNLARLGNKYLADTEPWKLIKTEPGRVKTIINISLQITANLSIILEPFLPFSMKKLREWTGLDKIKWQDAGNVSLLPPGHQVNKGGLLFEKIEDEIINRQIEKLMNTRKENEGSAAGAAAVKSAVTYEDFSKMDIRTATVLEAEKVPKTAKLLKLKIDCGTDIRTIVSGIAEYYTPESMVGRQILIIANLEPRTIKGIESKGMILMAEDPNGKLTLVSPVEKTGNGSTVK